jgi:hypothetical protein
MIPITMPEQRAVLDEACQLVGSGSLIPADKSYIQQQQVYDGQCKRAGLSNMNGLRHRYAQIRYEALTGWKAPKAGGPKVNQLDPAQRQKDSLARQQISRELGHERITVTTVYLGSRKIFFRWISLVTHENQPCENPTFLVSVSHLVDVFRAVRDMLSQEREKTACLARTPTKLAASMAIWIPAERGNTAFLACFDRVMQPTGTVPASSQAS